MEFVRDWLIGFGWTEGWATVGAIVVAVATAGLIAEVLNVVGRIVAVRVAPLKDAWIEALEKRHAFRSAAWVIMVVAIKGLLTPLLSGQPELLDAFKTAANGALVVAAALAVSSLITAVTEILRSEKIEGPRLPFKVLGQALQLVLWSYTTVAFLSVVTHRDVTTLLAGMTAVGAVLVYVFRDSILGWTAGVQISANDLAWPGDWIEVPAHGANGKVIEIALTTIKVRNWDETISTIPTYSLVSEGFRNWRGMFESGGRRIRRSVAIDATSLRCCDEVLLASLRRNPLLAKYLGPNRGPGCSHDAGPAHLLEGHCTTNLACFREWLSAWLKQHPKIHQGKRVLVRELEPAGRGIPVEIYVFSSDTSWVSYEHIQADIYDQVLAVLPAFDLRLFQEPTGADLHEMRQERARMPA